VFGTQAVDEVEPLRSQAFGSAAGVWRVRAAGDSAVLKLVRLAAGSHPRWPSRPNESDPYYWRREPLAYTSGLLGSFGVPACRACMERADGSVALWLDDGGDPPTWTPALLRGVAERLGRAQAALAGSPGEPWLSRGWLREYLVLHEVQADETVLARLDSMVQTVCHHDFHPANVLQSGAIIDWAYCGLAALGLDAGVLVADGVADGAFAPELADTVATEVWSGYVDGLRDGGFTGDEDDVRFAFLAGTALRLSWLPKGRSRAWDTTVDLLERWRDEARELA
jgi:hypothetical protein